MEPDAWSTATRLLQAASQLVDGVQLGLAERGFTDVRPVHGFAFVRLADGPATTTDLADHLGVTKQAAAQIVEYLVAAGYVIRRPHPDDRRARLLALTARGRACTRAAQSAAEAVIHAWEQEMPAATYRGFVRALGLVAKPGRVRPAW